MIPKSISINLPEGFLNEEVRDGYLITSEIKAAWAVQLDMVAKLLEVCNKHNLRIYADGGTLLGAIRHKGYIPWDDDIDLVMMREDYDKLMALKDEFEHPYFLQNIYTDPHYTHRHAQLRNSDTACWPAQSDGCPYKYNQGIFVDIFPADNMPITARGFSRFYRKEGAKRQMFRLVSKLANKMPEKLYSWMRNNTRMLSDKWRYAEYEKTLRSVPYNPLGNVCEISFQHGSMVAQYADYGEPRMADFEFIQIPIPQRPERLLALQYGHNYMTPHKAPSEHGTLRFDTENSYITLLK